jgi:hypothetical protein
MPCFFCPPPPESDSDFRLAPGGLSFTKLEYLILNHRCRRLSNPAAKSVSHTDGVCLPDSRLWNREKIAGVAVGCLEPPPPTQKLGEVLRFYHLPPVARLPVAFNSRVTDNILRVGINYKFDRSDIWTNY